MGKFTKRLLASLGAFFFLLIGALLVAPHFIPVDTLKAQVAAHARELTGRDIFFDGPASLRLLPNVQLTLENVRVANPEGFPKGDTFTLGALHLSLSFFDLLGGKVAIDRFELVEPVIALEKNAKGQGNWEFNTTSPTPEKAPGKAGKNDFTVQVAAPQITISNGSFSYKEPGKAPVSLNKLDVKLEAPSLDAPARIHVKTVYGQAPLAFSLLLDTPRAWQEGKTAKVTLETTIDAAGGKSEASFTGTAQQVEGLPAAKGKLKADSASLKALGKALGITLLPDSIQGEGALQLATDMDYQEPALALNNLSLTLDKLQLNGMATLTLPEKGRPTVLAKLQSPGVLVVNDLLAPTTAEAAKDTKTAPAGSAAAEGWSTEPVLADTSFLQSANADVTLALGGLKYGNVATGAITVKTTLKQGALALHLADFEFYGGKADLLTTLAAPKSTPVITSRINFVSIDMGRFLQDLNGFDKLAGKGTVQLSVQTAGVSQQQMVERLDGSGSLKMRDGAVKGINIAETVRNAKNLLKGQMPTAEGQQAVPQTDFAELSASFTLKQGLLDNRDLLMKAPLLTLTGLGTADLPTRRVDYRLRPTLANTLQGQDRTSQAGGALTVPLRVTGTFDALHFAPDMEATLKSTVQDALKDPGTAKENIKENIKGIKSLFKGL